jgi:hypothetical protein
MGQRVPHHAKKTKKYKILYLPYTKVTLSGVIQFPSLQDLYQQLFLTRLYSQENRGSQPERRIVDIVHMSGGGGNK